MNTKKILLTLAFSLTVVGGFAQSNLLNAKKPDDIGKKSAAQLISDNDRPLSYGFVDDRDVLMGKMVWENIDLDERINFPLLYPVDTVNVGKDRRSLFHVLIKGIKSGKISEVYADSYFNNKRTLKELENTFKFRDTLDAGRDEINANRDLYYPKVVAAKTIKGKKLKGGKRAPDTVIPGGTQPAQKELDKQFIDERYLSAQDVTGYKIKGYWYFDKRQGELKYRLQGICPIAPEAKETGKDGADGIELFWVYFPSAREVLHENYAFNDKNSAMPISYDNLLNSRRFNSVIYQEENVYGDRLIEDYLKDNAQMELLESERIKDKIRNFEQDMWNY
jgi:gliding motility associated protien GldN